ncbi:MAG TPA: Asp23/Gls24 family envelope stress response protein [Chloroflexia bacterium]|jgi:uncharacterized alkaline shock family protein YloU
MTSRHRKEQQKFNLQTAPISLNSQTQPHGDGQAAGAGKHGDGEGASHADAGKIEVSPRAISHMASRAAQSCYGVVGLASRHARPGLAELLRREEEYKGVVVTFSGDRVVIDLYVVIEYGTRISEVARNIMSSVRFAVESALGVPVVQVNVNVQGIRVSS